MSSTAIHINDKYLKDHYKEMMDVEDTPLPMGLLDIYVPEVGEYYQKRLDSLKKGEENIYSRYLFGEFSREGEDWIDEANRLLREYIMKHPEHKDLVIKDDAGILDYLYD